MNCRYCGRHMKVSPASYAENPFCSTCLRVRMELAREEAGPGRFVFEDGYAVWKPCSVLEEAVAWVVSP